MSRWAEHNPNPHGKSVGDCMVRALSKATGESWDCTYIWLCVLGFLHADMNDSNEVMDCFLRKRGFKRGMIEEECTVDEFAAGHPMGTYVLALGRHVVCVKDGMYWDSWDSGKEIPLYFWCKGED